MNVSPNETHVTGNVKQVVPCSDGQGFDVQLEIRENQSPDPSIDFLKPKTGDLLSVYSASKEGISSGQNVKATLALSGGPFQQRTILRKCSPITP